MGTLVTPCDQGYPALKAGDYGKNMQQLIGKVEKATMNPDLGRIPVPVPPLLRKPRKQVGAKDIALPPLSFHPLPGIT